MFFPEKVHPIVSNLSLPGPVNASVLRLDKVHPVVSGNKWYKLKEYLKEAKEQNKTTIVTFGGAFSNHIVATAAACQLLGFKSIGIIRGEKSQNLSNTLKDASDYGMHLFYISREEYKRKALPKELFNNFNHDELYFVNEGGFGHLGMLGASGILREADTSTYTHIITAVGTGTTLSGLLYAAQPDQQVIGISVMKGNLSLQNAVEQLVPGLQNFRILHDYHFGGYAKRTPELIDFMNHWYLQTGIPSDFVYTGKLFFAFDQLLKQNFFPPDSHVLVIHSGGLQGNRSLTPGMLLF